MLAALLSLTLSLASADLQPGLTLTYQGQLAAADAPAEAAPKSLKLTCVVTEVAPNAVDTLWTLHEDGNGGWPWLDRFGRLALSGSAPALEGARPAALFESEDATGVVEIPPLFIWPKEKLMEGAVWRDERLEHQVVGPEKVANRAAWKIDVYSPYGKQSTYWVEQNSPVVLAIEQRVTLGQGKRHDLRLELKETSQISAESLDKTVQAAAAWEELRTKLGWQGRSRRNNLKEEKLAAFRDGLAEATKLAEETALAAISKDAAADLEAQSGRTGAEAAMRNKLIGRPAPAFKLQGATGEKLATSDLAGQVTVLHFWDYRDDPLREPYGQVGFLDYLARSRAEDKTKIVGIAVDVPATGAERQAAARSVRRLKSFMNLSYSVLFDDGSALKQFGDPRAGGGELPLFVVIDSKGNVVHCHAGLYETRRDRGLEDLDRAVGDAAK